MTDYNLILGYTIFNIYVTYRVQESKGNQKRKNKKCNVY